MILVVDNYDSFTWNLVQRLGELRPDIEIGRDIVVERNDRIDADGAGRLNDGAGPARIIVSPGPCTPDQSGNSRSIIERFAGRVPILGVCLGHQCLAANDGMQIERHPVIMHGKTSPIEHDGKGVFAGLPNPLVATRYHSLVVRAETVPPAPKPGEDGWELSAWTEDRGARVVMGLRRVWADETKAPLEGVQFHPESFLTDEGPALLRNFLEMPSPVGV